MVKVKKVKFRVRPKTAGFFSFSCKTTDNIFFICFLRLHRFIIVQCFLEILRISCFNLHHLGLRQLPWKQLCSTTRSEYPWICWHSEFLRSIARPFLLVPIQYLYRSCLQDRQHLDHSSHVLHRARKKNEYDAVFRIVGLLYTIYRILKL